MNTKANDQIFIHLSLEIPGIHKCDEFLQACAAVVAKTLILHQVALS
ncbi:MAG TPA: hypothetical protein VMC85_04895 [Desulfomonilaceae bacterium]|nr:hypothetical protein [Desulfomonilaceae bacterium]